MRMIRWLLVLALPLVLIPACSKETEEDKVKKVITGIQQAAEEKKISSALDHLSKAYLDPQGNDYNAIKGLLAFYFFRHQKVSVYMPTIDITVDGQMAKVLFQAVLTGRGAEGGGARRVQLRGAAQEGGRRLEGHVGKMGAGRGRGRPAVIRRGQRMPGGVVLAVLE